MRAAALLLGLFMLLLCGDAGSAASSPAAGTPVVIVKAPTAAGWLAVLRANGFAARVGAFGEARAVVLPANSGVAPAAVARFVRGGGRLVTPDRSALAALGVRFGSPQRLEGLDGGIHFAAPTTVVPLLGVAPVVRSGAITVAGTTKGGRVLALGVDPLAPPRQGHELLPSLGSLAGATLQAPPGPLREAAEVYLDPGSTPSLTPEQLADQLQGVRIAFVAGWNYAFLDRSFDYPYARLIAALHARGIQAYAWLEPPMVGLGMWAAHPECREKTQNGQDAVVDWRSLIALESPSCFEIAWGIWSGLLDDFDWDGVNVAELYFETGDASRETPYHPSALALFGGDPAKDPAGFSAWRTNEVTALNRELVSRIRALRPELDVQLTVIDDVLDPRLARGVGSDLHALAGVAQSAGATLQVEDPYTTWTRGPARYKQLDAAVSPLLPRGRVLYDINVVPRANGHPTAQMTGGELALSVADASATTGAVGLYAAATLADGDLASATAALAAAATTGDGRVTSAWSIVLRSPSPRYRSLQLDGVPWPVSDGRALIPPGAHRFVWLTGANARPVLVRLTGELLGESSTPLSLQIRYSARGRAWATFDRPATSVVVDGSGAAGSGTVVPLPAGTHTAVVSF